jgi:hypothetical protein
VCCQEGAGNFQWLKQKREEHAERMLRLSDNGTLRVFQVVVCLDTLAKHAMASGYRLNLFSLMKTLLTIAKKVMPTINANPFTTARA